MIPFRMLKFTRALALLLTSAFIFTPLEANEPLPAPDAEDYIRFQAPELLTFDELKSLSLNPNPKLDLRRKLRKLWTTAIVSNEAYYEGERPEPKQDPRLGTFIRVASWNIEKSIRLTDTIKTFTDPKKFEEMIDVEKTPRGSYEYLKMLNQRARLAGADIILLQEMDIGVKRSSYRDAARELAEALKMNYAYGVEQLEIDPVVLGTEKIYLEDGKPDEEAMKFYQADPEKYKGLFGSAVLSHYPIKRAQVLQLKTQPYNWYQDEKAQVSFLEKARRFGTKTVFQNELTREMKVGGRIFFRVDLDVPELPEKTLTVINVHLEVKCLPEGRRAQLMEILYAYVKNIRNPVILAGDFNTTDQDLSAVTAKRVVTRYAKDPTSWLGAGVSLVFPQALLINASRVVSNATKNYQDPTVRNIPVLAPNSQKEIFQTLQDYRFNDGGSFDFRGEKDRSINAKSGTLANSNERGKKGFKTTFSVKRPLGSFVGKLKLDWFFVKAYAKDPKKHTGSRRLAPHFGETLEEMNANLLVPMSDHHPIVVDLPLEEPPFPRSS